MHDVTLHFGDLLKSWAKHGPEARGLLLNLLCAYYDREGPLPDDMSILEELAECENDRQKKLLASLLKRHLERVETAAGAVWKWGRCDLEIARFQHRCRTNSHNNLLKFVRRANEKGEKLVAPTFEEFESRPDHYCDPVTRRFRNLATVSQSPNNGIPIFSDSENIGLRKNATSGSHSPTLPLSHSPTFPRDSAHSLTDPIRTVDKPDSDITPDAIEGEKKEMGGGVDDPPDLVEYLKQAERYSASAGNGDMLVIPPRFVRHWHDIRVARGWETATGRLIPNTFAARWADLRAFARSAKVSGELAAYMAAESPVKRGDGVPLSPPSTGAPDGYRRAFAAMMGSEYACPGWAALDDATQGAIWQWLRDEAA